jgi:hypothetical protein
MARIRIELEPAAARMLADAAEAGLESVYVDHGRVHKAIRMLRERAEAREKADARKASS